MNQKIVFVTGATSGIGEATARKFAKEGHKVILTGRRMARLRELSDELKASGADVEPIQFDIRDREAMMIALDSLNTDWRQTDILINNAGLSLELQPFHEYDEDDWDTMIDTNIKGLLYISRMISEEMVNRGSGHIINIGSTAAKEVYRGGAVYCATKSAVDSITEGMRIDLLPHGIKVTAIHPGMVETEFSEVRFKGDKEKAARVYQGFQPLKAEDVAEVAWYAANQPPHVNLNDIVMTCTAQANSFYTHKEEI